ncbi:ROK family protein [Paenibacillus taiwanensis]|uniref:ROK family protein n=1 Tax=Paenibacillus taiwanensis TaxID=401638 RepID=UPI001FDF4246|nr:ROK family protein [Paenibacillus taiwanensis]
MRRLAEADIRFANDASLFALGVSRLYPSERLICLTLGTGLGSGFVDHGKLVEGRDGVPPSGMLYAERYRHAAVDEQFGRRGLIALADIYGARRHPQQDVQELALAARVGDKRAADAWAEYGFHLGRMLAPYTARFKPDRLVLGGQIAKSCDLWLPYLEVSLGNPAPVVTHQGDLMEHVFEGIELLFR